MALDLSQIPADVLADLRKRGHDDAAIAEMSPQEAFSEFCEWNGLIRWGDSLFSAANELKRAETK